LLHPQAGQSLAEDELRVHCEVHLGKFKTPKVIRFMEDLPKGPSGKIQRLKLPELVKRMEGTGA
jgi:long-chain acyl-CoA synthetase